MSNYRRATELLCTVRNEIHSQLPTHLYYYLDPEVPINQLYDLASKVDFITPRQLAMIRQHREIDKRLIVNRSNASVAVMTPRDIACKEQFQKANSLAHLQNVDFKNLDSGMMTILELARVEIDSLFWTCVEADESEFRWMELDEKSFLFPVHGFNSGPGSCTGVQGTSILQKYRKNWHTSSEMGKTILQLLRRYHKPIHDLPKFLVSVVHNIKGSYVPKRFDISRFIAPQLNGDLYLQYPADNLLRRMLLKIGIDLETQQDFNRTCARKGSLYDNGDIFEYSMRKRRFRPCTIDLVSASDIIGVELVKYEIPPPLFNYLNACRPERIVLDIEDNEATLCHMMATMGNAYCFPLQTLIFACIIRAIYRLGDIPFTDIDGFPTLSVYGDDIVVDISVYDTVINVLKKLHMVPNVKKSFSRNYFRESCGEDYFLGYNIRPVSTEYLQDDCDLYSLANRLMDWSLKHSVKLPKSIASILLEVTDTLVVPLSEGSDAGFKVPSSSVKDCPPRWRSNIHASVKKVLWHSPWPFSWAFSSEMTNITYTFLKRERDVAFFDLPKKWSSLFPFLNGGFKFVRLGDAPEKDAFFSSIVELPGKSSSMLRTVRTSPHWSDHDPQGAWYEPRYHGNWLLYHSNLLADMWYQYRILAVSRRPR